MTYRTERAFRRATRRRNQQLALGVLILISASAVAFFVYSRMEKNEVASLQIEDMVTGTGPSVEKGDMVRVHYTGWLADGSQFDSSQSRNEPYEFTLGAGDVIDGWEQGVTGMQVGGKRRLTIPPGLAYGSQGLKDVIPPNSILVFEIELIEIIENQ